jgi:hypothetical protein
VDPATNIQTNYPPSFVAFARSKVALPRFPLRFRHSAPDNAVHNGQQRLKTGTVLVNLLEC